MAAAGWLVIVEIVGNLIKLAWEQWGAPTEEIKQKLLAQITLPIPGEVDAAQTELESHLPPK